MSLYLRRVLLVIVPILLVARVSLAESDSAKERRARTACLSGDYNEGIRLLSELFVATMDGTYVFNQGRCFQQNHRYEDAIARFQEYLRSEKKLSKVYRAKTEKHIEECKALLADEKAQAAPVAVQALPPPIVAPPPAPVVVPAKPVAPPTPKPNPPSVNNGRSGLRTAGIITASVGAAALVGGIVFNLESNSVARDLKKTDGYTSDRESDRKTYATLAWVGYGVGAACVATGTVLFLLGLRSTSAPSVALVPAVGPDQAGAALKGTF